MILDETELVFGDVAYENRLVAFFDILGWKNEIAAAGDDPRRIARLAAAVRTFSANAGVRGEAGARLTTFSDNVVFSKPFAESDVQELLQSLATTQLGLAAQGFWLRGAVTVGQLYHDTDIVFGPALNRAYHLESKVACYPRILLDSAALPVPADADLIIIGEEVFLDPFTPQFWDRVLTEHPIREDTLHLFNERYGLTLPTAPTVVDGRAALASIATRLSDELTATDDPKIWQKLAWLFDRVLKSLGGHATSDRLPKSKGLEAALVRGQASKPSPGQRDA